MFRLDGKTALVTGASRGIGREIAAVLARQGARVVVAARTRDALDEAVAEIEAEGGAAAALELDLAEPDEIGQQLEKLPEGFRDIDILVNNAGMTQDNLLLRMSDEQWGSVLEVNLTGAFALTKALLRGMMKRRWGRIVTISSVVGLMGNPGQANYAASKAGLIGFSKSLAKEIGSRGITVNVVAPGYVETAMTEDLGDGVREKMFENIAVQRFGKPADIAAAVSFLASEEAAYVTGAVINVSGGLYM